LNHGFLQSSKAGFSRHPARDLVLTVAIYSYLADLNEHAKPSVWTAKPVDILEKVRRGKQALESEH